MAVHSPLTVTRSCRICTCFPFTCCYIFLYRTAPNALFTLFFATIAWCHRKVNVTPWPPNASSSILHAHSLHIPVRTGGSHPSHNQNRCLLYNLLLMLSLPACPLRNGMWELPLFHPVSMLPEVSPWIHTALQIHGSHQYEVPGRFVGRSFLSYPFSLFPVENQASFQWYSLTLWWYQSGCLFESHR